ncbi:MAG: winged helix-turn-helix domain-containing protein [Promethearchaeota archaeon]
MADSTTSEGSKTKDVLHFTPTLVKIVESPQAIRLLEDPDYYIIIEILRKRPMTIREIEDAYKLRAADHETVEPKSYNTIYRYIKALEKEGLVISGGKRVEFGKTAAETLFSRTAKLFHFGCPPDMSKEGREFVSRVIEGLMLVHGESKETETCLHESVTEISIAMKDEITKLASVDDKGKLGEILSGEWEYMIKILDFIAFFEVLLNHPELVKKLKDCF